MKAAVEIREAEPEREALAVAEIHLIARRDAMPYLRRPPTDHETRDYFAGAVGNRPAAWWVATVDGQLVGYMLIDGENLDHLYVRPGWQRAGVGFALLQKAKELSPRRLELWTFQRNRNARAFYESQGFRSLSHTEGHNEESEPDVNYEWVSV